MRIDRIRVGAFGALRDFDTGAGLDDLVVVLGPNEAGKSTLFSFLTTALYGFQPASRERSPHVPWGSDEASGSVTVRIGGEECAEIERRLRSQPTARLAMGGLEHELRNQAVPWVEHVPRAVFRQVFAVTLGDLASLDEETWSRIQDKVVGSMGASDLLGAREVAGALERETGELWRPNRRGKQRIRDLQGEIRALRARRGGALERDRRIRGLVEERDEVAERLDDLRHTRRRDRTVVDRAQTLLPLKRRLDRIAELRGEGGDREALQGLPQDPSTRLAELEVEHTRTEERRREVEAELSEAAATLERFDERARGLLERRDDVSRLSGRMASAASDRARADELQGRLREIDAGLDAAADTVLTGPWQRRADAILTRLSMELLAEHVGNRPAAASPDPTRPSAPVAWAATLAGLALLVWGASADSTLIAVLGAALAASGLSVTVLLRRAATRRSTGPTDAEAISELVRDVGVRADLLHTPGEPLLSGLLRLQELLREREPLLGALDRARARITEAEAEAARLARELGRDAAGDPEEIARALERETRNAERLQDAVAVAQREGRRLRGEHDRLVAGLAASRPGLIALREAGARLGGGDPALGLERAGARLAAHHRADQLEEELERAHPDLIHLKARLDASGGEALAAGDDGIELVKSRLDRSEEQIEALVKRGEALESEVSHLRDLETVDAVDGETASLREEEVRLVRERDRKWVLAQLIREADRRFREEHQPDLLRRAGSYLGHLTGGRYVRLVVDETGEGDLFRLVGPDLPAPVPLAPPVSTGTLEQAYLSLRLAIVDHLDHGADKLPIFVDEVFVNWDLERRARGLEVLAGLSGSRQVFVFTCHPAMAEELERRGGQIVRLGRER